jgi:hypothetical protein
MRTTMRGRQGGSVGFPCYWCHPRMQHVVIRLITPTERASNGGRRWRGPRFPSCCSCRWRPSAAGGQRRRCDTACGCRRLGVGHGRTGSQERDHLGGGRFSVFFRSFGPGCGTPPGRRVACGGETNNKENRQSPLGGLSSSCACEANAKADG